MIVFFVHKKISKIASIAIYRQHKLGKVSIQCLILDTLRVFLQINKKRLRNHLENKTLKIEYGHNGVPVHTSLMTIVGTNVIFGFTDLVRLPASKCSCIPLGPVAQSSITFQSSSVVSAH